MIGKLYRIIVAIFVIAFAIFWTYTASSSGAPWFVSLFGLFFIAIAVYIHVKVLFVR